MTNIDETNQLWGVTCPATTLCIIADGTNGVVTSTDPLGGVAAWTATAVNDSDPLTYPCPTVGLCVAVDGAQNNVVTTTDPTGGPSEWTVARSPPPAH